MPGDSRRKRKGGDRWSPPRNIYRTSRRSPPRNTPHIPAVAAGTFRAHPGGAPAEHTPHIPAVVAGTFRTHPGGAPSPFSKGFAGGCRGALSQKRPPTKALPTKAPPYKSGMPARSQVRMVSLSQREHCTSPMWAQPRISIHRRDCPIPPPMVRGSSPASSIL